MPEPADHHVLKCSKHLRPANWPSSTPNITRGTRMGLDGQIIQWTDNPSCPICIGRRGGGGGGGEGARERGYFFCFSCYGFFLGWGTGFDLWFLKFFIWVQSLTLSHVWDSGLGGDGTASGICQTLVKMCDDKCLIFSLFLHLTFFNCLTN